MLLLLYIIPQNIIVHVVAPAYIYILDFKYLKAVSFIEGLSLAIIAVHIEV